MKTSITRGFQSNFKRYSNRFLCCFSTNNSTTIDTIRNSIASAPSTPTFHRFHQNHTPRTIRVLLTSTFLFVVGRFSINLPIVRAFHHSSGSDCQTLLHQSQQPNHNIGMTKDGGDPCISQKATEVSINSATTTDKSTEDLQKQWAGGRDIWRSVPSNEPDGTISIQNRVRHPHETDDTNRQPWPEVVRSSVLYGFGAYNPRGRTLPHDVNVRAHTALQNDIESGLARWNNHDGTKRVVWWEGASVWEDGSSERGFVVACRCGEETDTFCTKVQEWVVELATRYDQGAIYRYSYEADTLAVGKDAGGGRLMRETIAVLDTGTDATVEVVRDDRDGIDFTPFGE